MPSKYPECDLCPSSNCEDEKLKQVLDDPDFTKAFVNNLLVSNIDEITKDSYFMAEVISEKTDPIEIADFAFCIYVTLSQLVEMPLDKRMEIAVVFRQEFDHMAEEASKVRQIAKKVKVASNKSAAKASQAKTVSIQTKSAQVTAKTPAKSAQVTAKTPAKSAQVSAKTPAKSAAVKALPAVKPVQTKPVPVARSSKEQKGETEKFLAELDQDIADIEAISGTIDKMIKEEPTPVAEENEDMLQNEESISSEHKEGVLEPVIGKLAGKPVVIGATVAKSKPAEPRTARKPELGSKANPIKLTPEMLAGSISEKDMARVDKGIKIKRVDVSKFSTKFTAPPQVKPETRSKTVKVAKIERIERSDEKEKALSHELFAAFQQIKTKDQLPNTFTPDTLGVGTAGKSIENEASKAKKSADNAFLIGLLKLSPEQEEKQESKQAPPAKDEIGDLKLSFDDEEKESKPKRKR